MRLTLSVNTTSWRQRIEVMIRALTDLNPPLRALATYLRAKFKGAL